ncbi:protein kinase, putative [Bodo saltans]|uniref:Protein kinase, putative n=1 Tax=Bodo saltans TaxID=75058 RepID=A0A0S4ISE3_BODSA|nr:protein kinase, putative [Bodo saltans]|eukprot:CUG05698.1 protein kinase, putative [Bodo saltans]
MSLEIQAKSRIMQGRVVKDASNLVEGASAYVLEERLEDWRHGSFGTVSKVLRLSDQKILIAKFIHLNPANNELNLRVIREIDNMERVKHIFGCVKLEEHFLQDNFVQDLIEEEYHGKPVGSHPPSLAVVLILENMEGGDIGAMITRGVFHTNVEYACVVFLQVIVGLHQIHQLNMIHRDIGAGNVLVDADGHVVKIADFGFSNSYEGETRRLDAVQTQLGTVSYRPPEVWKNERYGASADIFALGVLMYEAIRQEWAFGEYDEATIKERVVGQTAYPLECGNEQVSLLVGQMLQQDPAARPTTGDILRSSVMQDAFEKLKHFFGGGNTNPLKEECRLAIEEVMDSIAPKGAA